MVQIRYNFFETNSSSTCTLAVRVVQIDHLDIPPVVKIETTNTHWELDLNGNYALAKIKDDVDAFFGLLKYVGIKEIYLDGKLVEGEFENHHTKFRDERIVLASCFGNYKSYGEYQGHGGEAEYSSYLSKKDIKEIQNYNKNSDYILICTRYDNEIEWSSLPYSRMKITEEDIIKEERAELNHQQWLETVKKEREEEQKEYYRQKELKNNKYEDKEYEKAYDKRFKDRKHRKEQY